MLPHWPRSSLSASARRFQSRGQSREEPQATCKQLTKAEIQPLLSAPIATVKTTKSGIAGQECVFSSADSEADIDIVVDKGSFAKQGYAAEVKGYSAKVAVQGVAGTHAYRDTGDSTVVALKGDEYCSVSGGPVPGVGAIEEANGGSSNLPEHDHDVIATAFGTICNRIYGSGTTKPSLDGLSRAHDDHPMNGPPSSCPVGQRPSSPERRPVIGDHGQHFVARQVASRHPGLTCKLLACVTPYAWLLVVRSGAQRRGRRPVVLARLSRQLDAGSSRAFLRILCARRWRFAISSGLMCRSSVLRSAATAMLSIRSLPW